MLMHHVIDGLQRLTSIGMFLNDKVKAFGNYLRDYEDRDFYLRETYIKVKSVCLKDDDLESVYRGLNTR